MGHTGGPSPQFRYSTSPPPSLSSRPTYLPRVNSYRLYIWWRRRCSKKNLFPLPTQHPSPHRRWSTPTLSLNPTLTLTPTPTLSLLLTLHLIKIEYWDRAGGGGNISYDWSGTSRMIHTLMALEK